MLNIEQLKAMFKVAPKNDICDYLNGIYIELSNPSKDTYFVTDKHHLIGFNDANKIKSEFYQKIDHIFLPYAGIKTFISSNKWSKYAPETIYINIAPNGDIVLSADKGMAIIVGNADSASQRELKYPNCASVFEHWFKDAVPFDKNLGLLSSKTMELWELYQKAFRAIDRKILSTNGNLITVDCFKGELEGNLSYFLGSQLVADKFA